MCCLQPLQASAISALSRVCAKLSQIRVPWQGSPFWWRPLTKATTKTESAKNADGMRAPQPASMLETETSWAKTFASADEDEKDRCNCPSNRPKLTKECGRGGFATAGGFDLSKAYCCCMTWAEYTESLTIPVLASALHFCSALVEQKYQDQQRVSAAQFSFVKLCRAPCSLHLLKSASMSSLARSLQKKPKKLHGPRKRQSRGSARA